MTLFLWSVCSVLLCPWNEMFWYQWFSSEKTAPKAPVATILSAILLNVSFPGSTSSSDFSLTSSLCFLKIFFYILPLLRGQFLLTLKIWPMVILWYSNHVARTKESIKSALCLLERKLITYLLKTLPDHVPWAVALLLLDCWELNIFKQIIFMNASCLTISSCQRFIKNLLKAPFLIYIASTSCFDLRNLFCKRKVIHCLDFKQKCRCLIGGCGFHYTFHLHHKLFS